MPEPLRTTILHHLRRPPKLTGQCLEQQLHILWFRLLPLPHLVQSLRPLIGHRPKPLCIIKVIAQWIIDYALRQIFMVVVDFCDEVVEFLEECGGSGGVHCWGLVGEEGALVAHHCSAL
jgi:hypothetical protein